MNGSSNDCPPAAALFFKLQSAGRLAKMLGCSIADLADMPADMVDDLAEVGDTMERLIADAVRRQ